MNRRLTVLAAAAVLVLGVAACSDSSSEDEPTTPETTTSSTSEPAPSPSSTDYAGGPLDGIDVPAAAVAGAGWAPDGRLWVLTFGSSSNPMVATEVVADGQDLTVTIAPADPDGPATRDLQPTTSFIEVPETVDQKSTATVTIEGLGTVELVDGAAGWLEADSE